MTTLAENTEQVFARITELVAEWPTGKAPEGLIEVLGELARESEGQDEAIVGLAQALGPAVETLATAEPAVAEVLRQLVLQGIDALRVAHASGGAESGFAAAVLRSLERALSTVKRPEAPPPPVEAKPEPPKPPETFVLLPESPDGEMLGEYIVECRDLLDQAEAGLLTLETSPADGEAINTVFRAFHTIKGTSGFLGVEAIQTLAHRAETLLSRCRDNEIRYGGYYADLSLRSVDMIKDLLDLLQNGLGGEPVDRPAGYDHLIVDLADTEAQKRRAAESEEEGESNSDLPHLRMGDILVAEGKLSHDVVETCAQSKGELLLGEAMVRSGVAKASDVADALRKQKRLDKIRTGSVDSSLRVRTDRLDRLIEMVGELVIAHSMVEQDETVKGGTHYDLIRKTAHMGKIVRELQDLSMSMRMVPLRATFQKMTRLVRDVSQKMGKDVELITEGEDTEIDRNMVDAIGDPLVHMIRNACDHGVEPPEAREAAGKPRRGQVKLSACHSGGSVHVRIEDDGKGIDREKLVEKAISRGLIETDKGMSDSDVFSLIFEPGFSTAAVVTDVSGRGVGMDVVRRNVEALRGRIAIDSELGRGSTFVLQLPLTLAITDGMLLRVGSERYIVPTSNIIMSLRPTAEQINTIAGRGEMLSFRDAQIPVFRLGRLFGTAGSSARPEEGLLVIVREGTNHFALLVDEILGQQQIVAKSLGEGFGKIAGVSGGAILGDGRVGLILDPGEIGALARRGSSGVEATDAA